MNKGESEKTKPKISIFGLGYVGVVSCACLARNGYQVIGVDINPDKVSTIQQGNSPIVEPGLTELVKEVVSNGHLKATQNHIEAVHTTDISLICVGTPSDENGGLNLDYVRMVTDQISHALSNKSGHHTLAYRSTMLPGSIEHELLPILEERSGKQVGDDLGICSNPEFLREGSSIFDFDNPPFTIIGQIDAKSGDAIADIYTDIDAPILRTDLKTAAMVKYTSNVWHALKVTYANEIGNLCKHIGIDSHELMRIFTLDTKLNISDAYLKPGFAFGGSCLPKDLRAILHFARTEFLDLSVIQAIPSSNEHQINIGINLVQQTGKKKIGVLGFSFKENTDDLRESPMVRVIETLIGKGYDVRVYDNDVSLSMLIGENRRYIDKTIPHITSILSDDLDEVLNYAEVVIIGKKSNQFEEAIVDIDKEKYVIDLIRLFPDISNVNGIYHGICW